MVLGHNWVVLVSTWWHLVIIGWYWSVLAGTGSILGDTGQYLVVLGHYWVVLVSLGDQTYHSHVLNAIQMVTEMLNMRNGQSTVSVRESR